MTMLDDAPPVTTGAANPPTVRTLKSRRRPVEPKERGVVSSSDRKNLSVRVWLGIIQTLMLIGLIFAGPCGIYPRFRNFPARRSGR